MQPQDCRDGGTLVGGVVMSKRRAYGQPLSGRHCGACGHGRKNALLVGAARLELAWVAPHDPKSCMYANSITRPQRPAAPYAASGIAVGDESGGPRRIRTFDLGIKSPLLCQLSYRPTRCRPRKIMQNYARLCHDYAWRAWRDSNPRPTDPKSVALIR